MLTDKIPAIWTHLYRVNGFLRCYTHAVTMKTSAARQMSRHTRIVFVTVRLSRLVRCKSRVHADLRVLSNEPDSAGPEKSRPAQQVIPRASKCLPNPYQRRHQNISYSGLDLLNCSRIQINGLCKSLLCHSTARPFSPYVGAQTLKLADLLLVEWHAPLRRGSVTRNTAQ